VEGVEVAQVAGVLGREQRARDDDAVVEDGREAVHALGPVVGEAEPLQITVVHGRWRTGARDLQLEIPEAVERVRAAAGGDAAAVLRPGGGVLDVPELAVRRGQWRDRAGEDAAGEGQGKGEQGVAEDAHDGGPGSGGVS
jgi:hypothetical protein